MVSQSPLVKCIVKFVEQLLGADGDAREVFRRSPTVRTIQPWFEDSV
ncbi:hypothetical protein EYZ11_006828 [Aspergillus tanneri]|uniref:Uncharacterized protein n=1 Tax=Aspergillus tanneri TaxID=1220188 RepID=A0A4V3UP46_9EURO|nr:hypothetical protein EYZ11_006828 [Aspergillus tanneri]